MSAVTATYIKQNYKKKKNKTAKKLVQKLQQKADKVIMFQDQFENWKFQDQFEKDLVTGTRGTGLKASNPCPTRENHENTQQGMVDFSCLIVGEDSVVKAKEILERRNTPPSWHAALPLILNHLLFYRCQSFHWPRQRLDRTHRGINPMGSKTNEGDGFLHELVTDRIKPVK